jgi:hypothetical protein
MIRISVDTGGFNIKVIGFNAISPIHLVVLYVVGGKDPVCGCMAY